MDLRHQDIEDHRIRLKLARRADNLRRVIFHPYVKAVRHQQAPKGVRRRVIVIDH